jgi:cell division protein FtsL
MKARQRRKANILIFIALVIYVVFAYGSGIWKVRSVNRQIAEIDAEIQAWEERNSVLLKEITWLETTEYVEQVARKELGLVQPKETVFFITKE